MKKILLVLLGLMFMTGCEKNMNITNEKVGINEIKETTYEIKKISTPIMGSYDKGVNSDILNTLTKYDIKVTLDSGFGKTTNTYKVVKVKDYFDKIQISDYENVVFMSPVNVQVSIPKEEIEKCYFYFEKDGIFNENSKLNLLIPDKESRYSITNVVRIDIY